MSVFTKRRKKLRKQQQIEQKQKEENSKKFEKAMQDHIETCRIIKKDYPGYDNMNPENALKLYDEIYNKIHNE
ncbi:hypothetical protein IKN40_00930 [bacterium]|nr:hypothetical protein [bacterium]